MPKKAQKASGKAGESKPAAVEFPVGVPPIMQEKGLRGAAYSTDMQDLVVSLLPLVRAPSRPNTTHSATNGRPPAVAHPTSARPPPPPPSQTAIVAAVMAWVFSSAS